MLEIAWGASSDTGRVRAANEDSYLARSPVFVVADGMGGHVGGATASGLAVAAFRPVADTLGLPAADSVAAALERANEAILEVIRREPGLAGMGTTVVGVVLVDEAGDEAWLGFNVGDSRLYRFVDGELSQLSTDHSVVQELLDAGEITVAEVSHHRDRNVVTRALGSDPAPPADYWLLQPHAGERFLLCSDGLTVEVGDAGIAQILAAVDDPETAAAALVAAAVSAGGRDNVTAVVVQNGVPSSVTSGRSDEDTVERFYDTGDLP